MSNKVVPINRGRHGHGGDSQRMPVETYFVAVFILLAALPNITLIVYGPVVSLVTFGVVALVGTLSGLAMYQHPPRRPDPWLDAGPPAQSMPVESEELKKAS
jgi:hypothetical protein